MTTTRWVSGPWSLERRDSAFDHLCYAGRPVLRGIRPVVRDHDWGTSAMTVDAIQQTGNTVTLRVHTAELHGTVGVVVSGGRLTVHCDLAAVTGFTTNRTGLVVLHPYRLAGTPLGVTHPDGSTDHLAFPHRISPHQPARDISALAWTRDGLNIEVRFAGDVFEMEDQRNWTDASYKTYSRPLDRPFPYRLDPGDRVRQSVTVTVTEAGPAAASAAAPDEIRLSRNEPFPAITTGAAADPDPAPDFTPIGHAVLVELDLATPNWPAALDRAAAAGLPLDVRLIFTAGRDGGQLTAAVQRLAGLDVVRVGGFDRSTHVTDAATAAAVRHSRPGPVIGGARSHFTELNREQHRIPTDLDGVTFAVTPLFHDLDTAQLIESIAIQRLVAEQAVDIAAGRPVHVGPVTLRPRFNNVATAAAPAPVRDDLADGYGARFTGAADSRQADPWLAAWTVASAAALAVPGVDSISYFEQWGPRGVHSLPVEEALRHISALSGSPRLTGASPDGLIWATGARHPDGTTIMVSNLDDIARTITVLAGTVRLSNTIGSRQWRALHISG